MMHTTGKILKSCSTNSLPPPYMATQSQYPAEAWIGSGDTRTLEVFAPTIQGWLVRNDNYDHAGYWWNDNGHLGDQTLTPCLAPTIAHRTIDGSGGLPPYPYTKPPTPWRADGIVLKGRGSHIYDVTLFQIPGTALIMQDGSGQQAGTFSAFEQLSRVENVVITQAINGILCQCVDAKLSHLWISGIEKDGLILDHGDISVSDSHVWGADVSCRIKQRAQLQGLCYFEAARIGTLIEPIAHSTSIDKLYIGPATCREFGLRIQSNTNVVREVGGTVAANATGVYIADNTLQNAVHSITVVNKDAIGIQVGGRQHKISYTGLTYGRAVVVMPCTASTFEIRATDFGGGGVALDLSQSGLDKTNGNGNRFDVWLDATASIIYPGGGTIYNLAPGNDMWINGIKQGTK